MDRSNILKIVNEIQNTQKNNKEEYYGKKYPEFKEKYSNLFRVICTRRIDKEMLTRMLNYKDSIDKKEIDQFNASAIVGQELYDIYIKPKIDDRNS